MNIKLFKKSHVGRPNSGVTGYWLIEWKLGFSIVLLRFSKGSPEAFHSHAFNAWTWWIKGRAMEYFVDDRTPLPWRPSLKPKYTPRDCFHKIVAQEVTWAISFRGPWMETWQEKKLDKVTTLTHGRVIVE